MQWFLVFKQRNESGARAKTLDSRSWSLNFGFRLHSPGCNNTRSRAMSPCQRHRSLFRFAISSRQW